jgi:hypothetical protein
MVVSTTTLLHCCGELSFATPCSGRIPIGNGRTTRVIVGPISHKGAGSPYVCICPPLTYLLSIGGNELGPKWAPQALYSCGLDGARTWALIEAQNVRAP